MEGWMAGWIYGISEISGIPGMRAGRWLDGSTDVRWIGWTWTLGNANKCPDTPPLELQLDLY